MNIYDFTALELSGMIRENKISAKDMLDEAESYVNVADKSINCLINTSFDIARETAALVDEAKAAGESLSPLAGVPIAIKDNICVENTLTTAGSKILESFNSPYTASVIKKIQAAGLLVIGKANLDEFAMGDSCETSFFGATKNPRDLTRIPGGSSGGSAAAVASGIAPLAIGTDTGGSIRQPASFCGIVGFKPSYGAVSRYGVAAMGPSLDCIGPMARTVSDVRLLFNEMVGLDEKDVLGIEIKQPLEDFSLAGVKIAIAEEYMTDLEGDVEASFLAAVATLEAAGAVIIKQTIPYARAGVGAYHVISTAEASTCLARYDGVRYGHRSENAENIEDLYINSRSEGFGEVAKRRILLGTQMLLSESIDDFYFKAGAVRAGLTSQTEELFKSCDFLIMPTTTHTAPAFGEHKLPPKIHFEADKHTVLANLTGTPAISLPSGQDKNNMPIGLQIMAAKGQDYKLLSMAECYEALREKDYSKASIVKEA